MSEFKFYMVVSCIFYLDLGRASLDPRFKCMLKVMRRRYITVHFNFFIEINITLCACCVLGRFRYIGTGGRLSSGISSLEPSMRGIRKRTGISDKII